MLCPVGVWVDIKDLKNELFFIMYLLKNRKISTSLHKNEKNK